MAISFNKQTFSRQKSTNTRAADRLGRCDRAQLDHLQDHHRKQSGRPPGRDGPAESWAAMGARSAVNKRQRLTTTQPAASADAAEARTDQHVLGKGLSRVLRQHVVGARSAVQYHAECCPDAAEAKCCGCRWGSSRSSARTRSSRSGA